MRRLLLVTLVTLGSTGFYTPPALAKVGPEFREVPRATIGGVPVTAQTDAMITIGEWAINRARATHARIASDPDASVPSSHDGMRDRLVEHVEARGGALAEESIDVIPLLGGDVTLTVPVDVAVEEVVVDIDGLEVEVSASTTAVDAGISTPRGPGFAPYWKNDGDGDYVITVTGFGDALFTWSRAKLMNDGSRDYVWYAYSRKGDAHPKRRPGYDARVTLLRIQSYPFDEVEEGLLNWNEWDPASDFTGNCDTASYTAEISVLGATIGKNFIDCDRYTVWRNARKPGSYWIEMDQGLRITSGSREIGYSVAWKAKQGTKGSQHDFQRVRFRLSGDGVACDGYDWNGDETCAP